MKKRLVVYVPLLLLAIFALSTLAVHYGNIFVILDPSSRAVQIPFRYQTSVTSVKPEAERAGIRVGDRITAINGQTLDKANIYGQKENALLLDQSVSLSVE